MFGVSIYLQKIGFATRVCCMDSRLQDNVWGVNRSLGTPLLDRPALLARGSSFGMCELPVGYLVVRLASNQEGRQVGKCCG